jgi:hypothetical protein
MRLHEDRHERAVKHLNSNGNHNWKLLAIVFIIVLITLIELLT